MNPRTARSMTVAETSMVSADSSMTVPTIPGWTPGGGLNWTAISGLRPRRVGCGDGGTVPGATASAAPGDRPVEPGLAPGPAGDRPVEPGLDPAPAGDRPVEPGLEPAPAGDGPGVTPAYHSSRPRVATSTPITPAASSCAPIPPASANELSTL